MIITKIENQTKNPDRVSIYVDGQFFAGVSALVCHQMGLRPGLELTPSIVALLGHKEEGDRAWQYSLKVLGLAPKTREQMRQKLTIRFGLEIAEATMAKLLSNGLLDDTSVAKMLTEQAMRNQNKSQRELAAAMRFRNIERSTADSQLADLPEDYDLVVAKRLAEVRLRGKHDDGTQITKTAQYLSRKGFSYSVVKKVMSELGRDIEESG